jgi:hypothetical protein
MLLIIVVSTPYVDLSANIMIAFHNESNLDPLQTTRDHRALQSTLMRAR